MPVARGSRWTLVFLIVGSVVLAFGVMPLVYGLLGFHGHWDRVVKAPVPGHILFNASANLVVMLSAIAGAGRLDRRLAAVFTRTLVTHGALAFVILVTRQWYSIPILLTGVLASSVLGSIFALIRQRNAILRIGVIGPAHAIMRDPDLSCSQIEQPSDPVGRFDLIVITEAEELPAVWLPTLARALLAAKPVRHVSEFLEEAHGSVALEHFDLDHLPEGGLTSYRTRKRLLDLVCVVLMLPIAVPLVALAAFGIRLTMGAPVLFIQPRVGLGGRVFRMIKLRTMRVAPAGAAPSATGENDPRITSLGRWLRRFRIDEMPQLWNVVAGDMSFIGPRPEWTVLRRGSAPRSPPTISGIWSGPGSPAGLRSGSAPPPISAKPG